MRSLPLTLVLLASGLSGCGAMDISAAAARPDAVEARQITDSLARGDVAAVAARMDDSQRTAALDVNLELVARQFPQGAPDAVRLVGYQTNMVKRVGGSRTTISDVTFESKYGTTFVVTNVVLRAVNDGARRIIGLHTQALPHSLEVANGFSLRGKGLMAYIWLLAMIAAGLVTVAGLVLWFRRRHVTRHRWWWLLAILFGAFKLSINWSTGAFAIQALSVQLFSLSATRTGLGPWILSFSIPAGAIAFMINARQRPPAAANIVPS